MADSTREQGMHYEKLCLKWHKRHDISCRLTHASGQLGRQWSDWRADLDIGLPHSRTVQWRWKGEVKSRADATGWTRIQGRLGGNDGVVLADGYTMLTEHGYAATWAGSASPVVGCDLSSSKALRGMLAQADMLFLYGPGGEAFSVFLAWDIFVEILRR